MIMNMEVIVITAACLTVIGIVWLGVAMAYKHYYGKIEYARDFFKEENRKLREENEQLKEQIREQDSLTGNHDK